MFHNAFLVFTALILAISLLNAAPLPIETHSSSTSIVEKVSSVNGITTEASCKGAINGHSVDCSKPKKLATIL
ncbi:hypothetical protein O181_021120 [Austropuccinia psidii MF-1]|uniref:Uncharacterized protein n=1 Tax=Austropuccinia psidii MF-1 TaxID=1389203 RepID=A0A9Q3GWS4_9BASI|nr:hypothetical protein [Austropuccinia psidii MF-1]